MSLAPSWLHPTAEATVCKARKKHIQDLTVKIKDQERGTHEFKCTIKCCKGHHQNINKITTVILPRTGYPFKFEEHKKRTYQKGCKETIYFGIKPAGLC